MGLFSKKDYVCTKCGKTYQSRLGAGLGLCDDCFEEQCEKEREEKASKEELKKFVIGYVEYGKKVLGKKYSSEEMQAIADHRSIILNEDGTNDLGISKADLYTLSENYMNLSDEQCMDILNRVEQSKLHSFNGAALNKRFILPSAFEGVVVKMEDVFAVGYTSMPNETTKHDCILCVLFTNDPYIPVIPMIYIKKMGMFEIIKSKKGREEIEDIFDGLCPNLQYPISELKVLKKTIKSDGVVKGKLDKNVMLEQISNAELGMSIFNLDFLPAELNGESELMMNEFNYMTDDLVKKLLKLDKSSNRKFWESKIKMFAQQ